MAIHRYFFWIEDNEIEIYKNGKQVLYRGEKRIDYSTGIANFFDTWKENSAYIDGDFVDFIFIGSEKEELEKFVEFCKDFIYAPDIKFTFEDLKNILDNKKNLKKFCLNIEKKEYFLQKTEFNYNRIPKNKDLTKIYVYGDNIEENFLSEGITDLEIEIKNTTESKMAAFFKNRL